MEEIVLMIIGVIFFFCGICFCVHGSKVSNVLCTLIGMFFLCYGCCFVFFGICKLVKIILN